jgi:hypothetical protein
MAVSVGSLYDLPKQDITFCRCGYYRRLFPQTRWNVGEVYAFSKPVAIRPVVRQKFLRLQKSLVPSYMQTRFSVADQSHGRVGKRAAFT